MKVTIKPIEEAPNLDLLKTTFNVDSKNVIIAYGDTIYCPKEGMSKDLLEHELTHCERQNFNKQSAERWWQKYMEDKDFRLQEELIAYVNQYKFCEKVYKDRNARARILHFLSKELASERYGNLADNPTCLLKLKSIFYLISLRMK